MRCLFCGKDLVDDEATITDDCGEVACKGCGEAEIESQRREKAEAETSCGLSVRGLRSL